MTPSINKYHHPILGTILREYLERSAEKYSRVVYVGDGQNDLCPLLQLGKGDVGVVRKGYSLDKALALPLALPHVQVMSLALPLALPLVLPHVQVMPLALLHVSIAIAMPLMTLYQTITISNIVY